jgi:hypothetical protein
VKRNAFALPAFLCFESVKAEVLLDAVTRLKKQLASGILRQASVSSLGSGTDKTVGTLRDRDTSPGNGLLSEIELD